MNFICGIDGGGTETKVLCRLDDGKMIKKDFGPFNLNSVGPQGLETLMKELIVFWDSLGTCKGLCIGAAGISNPKVSMIIVKALEQVRISRYRLLGDHEIALQGALGDRPGMAIIAGTGSICIGRDSSGKQFRCGGWGHLIGDQGSGYALGRDAVTALTYAIDGMAPSTLLSKLLMPYFDADNRESLIRYVYNGDKRCLAALAPSVLKAAEQGDCIARNILMKNADDLCRMAQAVFLQLGMGSAPLALLGGLFNASVYREMVVLSMQNRNESIHPIAPEASALEGALDIASELAGNWM